MERQVDPTQTQQREQQDISDTQGAGPYQVRATHRRADIQVVVSDLTQADSVFSLVKELRHRDLIHKVDE